MRKVVLYRNENAENIGKRLKFFLTPAEDGGIEGWGLIKSSHMGLLC